MAIRKLPAVEYLRQVLDYNAETGDLIWKKREAGPEKWNTRFAGKKAGHVRADGREVVAINGILYYSYRIIWAINHGYDCELQIDHKDLNKQNNLLSNLRKATHVQNNANKSIRKDNVSGSKGVCFVEKRQAFLAQLVVNKKRVLNKYFRTKEDAEKAYLIATELFLGEFARTE